MKKLIKVLFALGIMVGLIGCQSKSHDVAEIGKIFEDSGYTISRQEMMKDDRERGIFLTSKKLPMIASVFNKDKSIQYIYFGIDKDIYVVKGDKKAKEKTTKDMKSEYEDWLKEMGLSQDDIENYFTDLNKQVREPMEIQKILDECDFVGNVKIDDTKKYEYNFYLESEKGFYTNGYFKDDKLVKLIFASDVYSTADKLFVYEDGKVTKDDGMVSYSGFLMKYNITNEEFINYFTALYKQHKD